MPVNYSDADPRVESTLRLLCAIVSGRSMDPPPAPQRLLLDLAREHRLQYLLAWRLGRGGGDLESWFGDAAGGLLEEVRTQALVDALSNDEIRRVVAGISMIPGACPVLLKGAALGHSLYPESWLRPRLDTDLLVSASSVAPTIDALRVLGYQRDASTSGALITYQAAFERTDRFDITHHLDLHWKIANWQLIADVLAQEEIATRAVPIPALGPAARGASPGDALVLACLHRAAHHRDSEELLWIYDIHLLAERLSDADWRMVVAAATRGAVTALCARGLTLATDRFGTSIPVFVIDGLRDAQPAGQEEPSAVYLSRNFRLVDGLMSDLRAVHARVGVRLLKEHLFPPPAYMKARYGARSRPAMVLLYVRRIVAGLPKWFASGRRT